MSNEIKIGLMAVIIITLFVIGYKFLEGKNVFTTSRIMYVEYENVEQLAASAPVIINGFQVGTVSELYLKPEDLQTIVAVLTVERDIKIPKNTIAQIVSTGLMSGKAVRLVFDKPCSGGNCAESGDYLQGASLGMLESMLGTDELDGYFDQLAKGVGKSFDALNVKINDEDPNNKIGKSLRDLQAAISTFKNTADNLNHLIAANQGKITGLMSNLESITGSFKESEGKIKTIIDNTATMTGNLKDIQLGPTLDTANMTLTQAKVAIADLQKTLKVATTTLGEFSSLAEGVKAGKGTIGLMFTDDGLYHRLNATSMKLDSLLTDLKDKPYRYVPLKSRNKIKRYDRKDGTNN